MTERRKVLIVDDDKTWQALLQAGLQDHYDILAALDGNSGLTQAGKWLPDLILLDIEMPLKNGFDVCTALKADPLLRHIPVIFLSAKSSLHEKITGFKVGADDYLVKPCDANFLLARIDRSIRLYDERIALDKKAEGAEILAFEAMNSSADLGRSVRFAERTFAMDTFDKLAEGLFQTMAEFGLETSVMFVSATGPLFYSHNKIELSPLEKDIFLAIHAEGRFCDFGNRTFCNFKRASLLIKNMPESDPERYGRIKDTVPWILGATDGKVGALDEHMALVQQHHHVSASLTLLTANLEAAVDNLIQSDSDQIKEILAPSLALLDDLRTRQMSVDKILKNKCSSNPATELSDEIFSSDVDFF